MKHSPRLFHCLKCSTQVLICSHCDRGQIYCSKKCSSDARRTSCREAEKRYQLTLCGKIKHALRQKRYRMRQKEKVTDHGSIATAQDALLESVKNETTASDKSKDYSKKQCSFCKKVVSMWIRSGFLRYYRSYSLPEQAYLRPP